MQLRDRNLDQFKSDTFDVLVIGAGINGAVSAAALAGKGAKVALIDQRDFAGFTSQESSNLAWGGIKYLESYDIALVNKLCKSRNELMRHYPSSVREIRFLTSIPTGFRHHPMVLWLGAWMYWALGRGFTRPPRRLSPSQLKQEEPILNTSISMGGLEYSDAYLYDNDARFVFNFVRTAMEYGCSAANYVEATHMERRQEGWVTDVRDTATDRRFSIRSRVLVNAAGPFVDHLNQQVGLDTDYRHVFSKGIHLIVNQVAPSQRVLAFFASDGRLFFAIPMGQRTCIGTTDTRVDEPLAEVTDTDRQFVLDNINQRLCLPKPLTQSDIIAERCGVRPLAVKGQPDSSDDFFQLSRQHAIEVNRDQASLSIFGGKLTDCLNVGDEVCQQVENLGIAFKQRHATWYGDADQAVKQQMINQLETSILGQDRQSLAEVSERLWRRYGRAALTLVEAIQSDPTQAEVVFHGYIRGELQHMAQHEMIVSLDDFLRRRTMLALEFSAHEIYHSAGLMEVCQLLFGTEAEAQFNAYFRDVVAVS